MRRAVVCLLFAVSTVFPAAGQSTNLALYQELAVDCLGDLPSGIDSLVVASPERLPFVRSALVAHWQAGGLAVFLPDSSVVAARLSYSIEDADVSYQESSDRLSREIRLAIRYTLTNGRGRVLLDDRCEESRSDLIDRGALDRVQHEAYPETQGELPEAGWFRRVLEPVVITAASAVIVYLFFTLRTTRADDS